MSSKYTPVARLGEQLTIEILRGNGVCNLILSPNTAQERIYTVSPEALSVLAERLTAMSQQEEGFDIVAFDLYQNELPPEEDVA